MQHLIVKISLNYYQLCSNLSKDASVCLLFFKYFALGVILLCRAELVTGQHSTGNHISLTHTGVKRLFFVVRELLLGA